jgi:hypothetical protein
MGHIAHQPVSSVTAGLMMTSIILALGGIAVGVHTFFRDCIVS